MAAPRGLTLQQVKDLKPTQVKETIGRVMLADGFDLVYDLDKSKGCNLYDSFTNKEYMDVFSFFASQALSHNHPKLRTEEFMKEMGRVAIQNPSNSDIYSVEMAQFVATFERVCMTSQFKHLFLVAGGALAVENALKAAFDWKVRKNLKAGKGEKGSKIIHFYSAFHGRSGYTLSLTNTADPRKYMFYPRFDWPRIPPPACKFPLEGKNLEDTIAAEKEAISKILAVLEKDADDVAGLLIEGVQAEGGDNHWRPEFWQELRKICTKYDILFIDDEVQSGMGLTGKQWAWEHYGPAELACPDIVSFGKKAQVCGIIATDRIDEIPNNVFKESSRINSTWGDMLTNMVRSRRIIEIIEEDKLVENAAQMGKYLVERLHGLAKEFPKMMSNIRGRGLMCAFDLPSGKLRDRAIDVAYEQHLLLLKCGSQSIRLRPFLDISKEQIDKFFVVLTNVLKVVEKEE